MDLEEQRKVTREALLEFAGKYGAQLYETSAKTDDGVRDAFLHLASLVRAHRQRVASASGQLKPKKANCSLM